MKPTKKDKKSEVEEVFIIRKDILWLSIICLFGGVICYLLAYDIFFGSIWGGLLPDSNSHNPFKGKAIVCLILGAPVFSIGLLYHLFTFRFKYLEISKKGINDKMSIFNKEFIPFNEVKEFHVKLNPSHIIVKHGNKKKTFTELSLKEEQARKLNAMYFSLIHRDNPPKVTNFLYHK